MALHKINLSGDNKDVKYDSVYQFLENRRGDNVIFCCGNHAVIDMIRNLVGSAKAVDMDVVVFCLDNKLSVALDGTCDVVNYFDDNVEVDKFYEQGSKEFDDVVWQRWLIGNEILGSGKSFVCMDVDVVVRKNFENELLSEYESTDYDCLVQYNGKNACVGFISIRPTERSVDLYTMEFLEKNKYMRYGCDQGFFNDKILKKKFLNVGFLNRDKYPNGEYYYDNHERINDICNIVHFNGIRGYDEKIDKMREHGLWILQ